MFMVNENFTVTKVAFAYYKKVTSRYLQQMKKRPYFGLTLILSGSMKITFSDGEHIANKGDIILQRQGDSYNLQTVGEEPAEYIVISYLCDPIDKFEELLPKAHIFHPERPHRYNDSFERAANICFSSGVCYVPLLCALVQEIICNIIRENFPKALSANSNPAAAARYYIEEYSNRPITCEDIANAADCSPSYLRFLFKSAYGETTMRYLNRVRIERAKEMLLTDMFRLDEIAIACGFRNVYYFSRVFKEFTGTSPGSY